MEIKDKGLPIHEDARLKVRPRVFLEGNFFVDIQPGSPSSPVRDSGDDDPIPATQTAAPVQLGDILTTLQSDTRKDLQVILQEYSKGISGKGAQGIKEFLQTGPKTFKSLSLANDATLGKEPTKDIQRLLKGQEKVFGALASNRDALAGLVTTFNVTAGAFASQDTALEASVPALRDTLKTGQTSLAALNSALPSLRQFSVDALPGVKSSGPTLREGVPFMTQAAALVQPSELQGTAKVLAAAIPPLNGLSKNLPPFLEQARLLSSCTSNVLVPFGESKIPNPDEPGNDNQPVYRQFNRGLVGLSGESRLSDGNQSYFHVSGVSGLNYLKGGAPTTRPAPPYDFGEQPPARQPQVPCETQSPPDLNAAGGLVSSFASKKQKNPIPAVDLDVLKKLTPQLKSLWVTTARTSRPSRRRTRSGSRSAPRRPQSEARDPQALPRLRRDPGARGARHRYRRVHPVQPAAALPDRRGGPVHGQGRPPRRPGRPARPGPDRARPPASRSARSARSSSRTATRWSSCSSSRSTRTTSRSTRRLCCARRPGLKDMFIEVDPGTGKPLPENGHIQVENSAPDIDQDEILAALDTDTRDYLKLLISGGGKGLKGKGQELQNTFAALGPTNRDLERVTTAIARRRQQSQEPRQQVRAADQGALDQGQRHRPPGALVQRDLRGARVAEPGHLGGRRAAAGNAAPDQHDAREGRDAQQRARADARVAAARVPPARHYEQAAAAVLQDLDARDQGPDPAVRAQRAALHARPRRGRPRPQHGRARPDDLVQQGQPPLQHRRLQPHGRGQGRRHPAAAGQRAAQLPLLARVAGPEHQLDLLHGRRPGRVPPHRRRRRRAAGRSGQSSGTVP